MKTISAFQRIPKEAYPKSREKLFLNIRKDGYSTNERTKVNFDRLVQQSSEEILQMREFIDFAEYVQTKEGLRCKMSFLGYSDTHDSPPYHLTFAYFVQPFLSRYFYLVNAIAIDEKAFNELYSDIEKFFYSKIWRFRVTSPLANFSCDSEIRLDKLSKIRKISETEMNDYLRKAHGRMGFPSPLDGQQILKYSYVLESVHNHKTGRPFDWSGTDIFEDAITALRLYKCGFVDYTFIRYLAESWNPVLPETFGETNNYLPQNLNSSYVMDSREVSDFILFWKKYAAIRRSIIQTKYNRYLQTAIKRFNLGIEETGIEDKIIDFLISAEALYQNETTELTFKLSNRIASLLGKTDDEREKIKDIIVAAYSLRSTVVHGKEFKEGKLRGGFSPELVVQATEDLLRKSILCFMKLAKKYPKQEDILKELDASLLNTKKRKNLKKRSS
jgi:hypothetical protein